MIIAWVCFIIGIFCTLMFLYLALTENKLESKKNYRKADFWIWLIIAMISAQYIWG